MPRGCHRAIWDISRWRSGDLQTVPRRQRRSSRRPQHDGQTRELTLRRAKCGDRAVLRRHDPRRPIGQRRSLQQLRHRQLAAEDMTSTPEHDVGEESSRRKQHEQEHPGEGRLRTAILKRQEARDAQRVREAQRCDQKHDGGRGHRAPDSFQPSVARERGAAAVRRRATNSGSGFIEPAITRQARSSHVFGRGGLVRRAGLAGSRADAVMTRMIGPMTRPMNPNAAAPPNNPKNTTNR